LNPDAVAIALSVPRRMHLAAPEEQIKQRILPAGFSYLPAVS